MSTAAAASGAGDGSAAKPVASSGNPTVVAVGYRRHKDPVSLYQKYRDSWEKQKPPGTDSRLKLRWDIREQFHHQHEQDDIAADRDKVRTTRC